MMSGPISSAKIVSILRLTTMNDVWRNKTGVLYGYSISMAHDPLEASAWHLILLFSCLLGALGLFKEQSEL